MIRKQWYAILESREVPADKPVGVTRMGEKLVLWRTDEGKLVCMKDLCPHRGVALSTGKKVDGHLQCPFHGFEYDASGKCVLIPANGVEAPLPRAMKVQTYPVREKQGFIWIWWGEHQEAYPPIAFFESLEDKDYSYSTLKDRWETHYSRAIENQLDVLHLPFIHRTTIGRGNKTVVDGPIDEWDCEMDEDCNLLNIWVMNRIDDGQPARRERDLTKPDRRPYLQFQFPNIWQNWISDEVRVMVAFAPIDRENTMLYLRFYQKMVQVPVLKGLVHSVGKLANRVIARQDKWVVETQRPKRSDLRIGETLVPGDGPIIEYRRRRRELIEAAGEE
jgi:phenylpropionate dioxygenase-like ring-hydroxylating dioxygenase large terminal subunit